MLLTRVPPAALATIVDLVGWDGANFYEGALAPVLLQPTQPDRHFP